MRKTVNDILGEVAAEHWLTVEQLLSKTRKKPIAHARFKAMYRIFTECSHVSYPDMARRMGGFDHTSCLHGVRRYCEMNGISYDAICAQRRVPPTNSQHFRYGTVDKLMADYGKVMENARAV